MTYRLYEWFIYIVKTKNCYALSLIPSSIAMHVLPGLTVGIAKQLKFDSNSTPFLDIISSDLSQVMESKLAGSDDLVSLASLDAYGVYSCSIQRYTVIDFKLAVYPYHKPSCG